MRVVPAAPAGLYSASDADVTPPEPIRPQWFNVLPAGVRPDDVVIIDFVVDERGNVESAKIRIEPRSVGESMLLAMSLQALKSWQFRPAVKEGRPVKYRQARSFGGTPAKNE
jgi:TonB family protein